MRSTFDLRFSNSVILFDTYPSIFSAYFSLVPRLFATLTLFWIMLPIRLLISQVQVRYYFAEPYIYVYIYGCMCSFVEKNQWTDFMKFRMSMFEQYFPGISRFNPLRSAAYLPSLLLSKCFIINKYSCLWHSVFNLRFVFHLHIISCDFMRDICRFFKDVQEVCTIW